MLFTASKTKKAKKTAKKVAKRAEKAGERAQERAAEFAERAGARAQETASEIAERLRDSDTLAKAQARSTELASLARDRWDDAHLDDRAAELADRIKDSDRVKAARKRGKEASEEGLAAAGAWLSKGKSAKLLGVSKRRSWPIWLVGLVALGVGFIVAKLLGERQNGYVQDDFVAAAERLHGTTADPYEPSTSIRSDSPTALADDIRSKLADDPRTAELSNLAVNVAEGTVFVRGSVPEGTDESAIREVVSAVPGVSDVDLQLTAAG